MEEQSINNFIQRGIISMFDTIFSYKRNAYSMSKDEKDILMMFIDFFKYEIPGGNGSYLAMLDLDSLDFVWSPYMTLNDTGVFGMWILTFPDKVFLRPSGNDVSFAKRLDSMKLTKKEKEAAENIKSILNFNQIQFRNLNLNQDLLRLSLYLCECDGIMLSTIFHELYHKWQYSVSKILYIVNFFVFLFTGYEFSTKSKYSIEGDVRIYIDNEEFHNKLGRFYSIFYKYLYIQNKFAEETSPEMKNDLLKQLTELETSENRYYKFCEKLLNALKN